MGTGALSLLMEKQVAAYLSGDIEPFLDCFADDAAILPSTAKKPIETASKVRKWIRTNAQIPKYQMTVVKSEEDEGLAYQLIRYKGMNKNDAGRSVQFSGYLTRIVRREKNGDWKIVCATWKDDN
ncbi:MAG: nuclear transport factor 2 family protein [Bradyrhizobium sp.]|uniref:YybH family protein n=1 Tax=Bradyrhizobium sp. TaxID=376 RepID=UPI0012062AF5|nr:DUF4440 domain-containing protein [Bradyrhizobium sp.]THD62549.1 MAG: nuclear transport factor 2 family protein [Bradyrhizobium sp.]